MKSITTICFLLIAFIASAQTFEGVMEISTFTQSTNENATVKWYVKNGNSRMEITGTADGKATNTTLLFQKSSSQFYLLGEISGKKAAFAIPQDSVAAVAKNSNAHITKADGKKTIAGYNCYLIKIESTDGTTECWVSDDVNVSTESLLPSLRSKGIIGILKANGINALPLDVTAKNASGETTYSFSVRNITPLTLSESLFTLPADAANGEEQLKKSIKAQ